MLPEVFTPGQYSLSKSVKNNRGLGRIISSHQLLRRADMPCWKNNERKRLKISPELILERRQKIVIRILAFQKCFGLY